MPDITITVSQKIIDRVQVLTDEHNAREGESLSSKQMVKKIIKHWASGEAVNAAVMTALQDYEANLQDNKEATIEAALNTELENW